LSDKITKFPANISAAVGQSKFSHSYFSELTMSAIDSLNILYVAITRAIRELHIIIPSKYDKNSIANVVTEAIGVEKDGEVREFGTPERYSSTSLRTPSLSLFATHSPSNKVAVRYTHQRYDEESRGDHLAPRDFGVMMHRAMENAKTREDIEREIARSVTDGVITAEEATILSQKIESALAEYGVQEWFDGSWQMVRSECEIVDGGRSWRPDRVMTRQGEAVVVDYKFGLNRPTSYRRQIEKYCRLLQQMGYPKVKGYLWYMTIGEIEQIV
jgi:ATP-dependent exoDNAse (exonuclease V) beta subunit